MSDQHPQRQSNQDDEIDLRKLFHAIGRFFVSVGHGIIQMILSFRRVTFRYKILLGIAVILGVIAGIAYNQLFKPHYQTSLLLKSDYLNAKLVENGIDKLNLLCEEDDRFGLSKTLNIDIEEAINIREFEYESFVTEEYILELGLMKQRLEALNIDKADIETIVEQIEIENQNTFMISVSVLNTNVIDNLEPTVVGYFRNNPYVANRIKSNKARLVGLVAKLTSDIVLLDSLKNAYNFSLIQQATKSSDASNSLILAERSTVDPTKAYAEGVTLFQILQDSKTDLELGSDFELVDGFTTFSKPESPGLLKSAVLLAGIFLALAYTLILIIEINRYLNRIEEHGFSS